ncbi:ClpP/crotonase [Violaceomyces palustris]|uniref:ClpP/crotonase n=1 Tax=Violaceomyces palustris TaxID=1673888 RepID=A0ACD0NXX2_9BASI|nr:ClpP/crotonase [Violaceomyces palustris]
MTSHMRNPHPRVSDVDAQNFDYSTYPWQHIKVETLENGVAIVYLHRPDRANAFTGEMCASLVFAFELLDADNRVKAVILTGSGNSFCAGADLTGGFGSGGATYPREHRDGGGQTALSILRCRKVTIAAINGNAVGIGLTMTLPCDFRLVSEKAKVAIPFTKRGIAMEATSSYLLPRLVGNTKALDLILSGDTRYPDDISLLPLWTRPPLPSEKVLPTAIEMATKLATENSIVSMALCKAQIWRGLKDPEETHLIESQGIYETSRVDANEGIKSFFEKRKPRFQGTVQDLERFGFYPWWTQADVSGKISRGPKPKL